MPPEKAKVQMKKALELVSPEDIQTASLLKLLQAIEKLLSS